MVPAGRGPREARAAADTAVALAVFATVVGAEILAAARSTAAVTFTAKVGDFHKVGSVVAAATNAPTVGTAVFATLVVGAEILAPARSTASVTVTAKVGDFHKVGSVVAAATNAPRLGPTFVAGRAFLG